MRLAAAAAAAADAGNYCRLHRNRQPTVPHQFPPIQQMSLIIFTESRNNYNSNDTMNIFIHQKQQRVKEH